MPQTTKSILEDLQLYSDKRDYTLLKLPAAAITLAAGIIAEIGEPYAAMLCDKAEVTLCIPVKFVDEFSSRLENATPYGEYQRLITFETELDPTLVGFIAQISRTLASEGISALVYCAFSRDHFFVPSSRYADAVKAIQSLAQEQ